MSGHTIDKDTEGLETPSDHVIFSVQNVHAYASACSLKVLRASPGSGNLLRPSFSPYSCAVSWICFGPLLLIISYDDCNEWCIK